MQATAGQALMLCGGWDAEAISHLTWKHPARPQRPTSQPRGDSRGAAGLGGHTTMGGGTRRTGMVGEGLSEPGAFVLCLGCWKAAPRLLTRGEPHGEQGFLR